MSKKCCFEGCKDSVEWVCECKTNNYFCYVHLGLHFKRIGRHGLDSLFIEPDKSQKAKILLQFNEKLENLNRLEAQWRDTCTSIINNINQNSKKVHKAISDTKLYLKSILKIFLIKGEIEKEEFEKGFKLDSNYYEELLKEIRFKCNGLFDKYSKKIGISQPYENDEDYFFIVPNQLVKINLTTMKKVIHNVQYPSTYQESCKLRDGKFFIHEYGTANCYLADLVNNMLTKLPNCPVSMTWGIAGYIDSSVYLINDPGVNEKFDLNSQIWSKIAKCPSFSSSIHNVGGVISKNIYISCLTSNKSPHIYNPLIDTYNSMQHFCGNVFAIGHGFVLASQCVSKVMENDELSWSSFPYRSKVSDPCFCWMNQYIFKRNEFLYFCKCGQNPLYRFNTITYCLETVSYS